MFINYYSKNKLTLITFMQHLSHGLKGKLKILSHRLDIYDINLLPEMDLK